MMRERARARAVDRLGIVDLPAEPLLDGFIEQAAAAFSAPIAIATLLRDRRLWVKAGIGVPLGCLPRDRSFCTSALDRSDLLEVCDALADPMFRDLPVVTGGPNVRYYIGAPLRCAEGSDVGMLCVLDTRARPPASMDQRAYLRRLAGLASVAMDRHARIGRGAAA